tara:strand:- start:40 stop:297 length:258 start_codon:yes stop_codon:yes gene_type:complete
MTNLELLTTVRREGVAFSINKPNAEKLSAIFQAWMRKHAELIDEMADYFYSKENNTLNFRDILYELFVEDSREYDNHTWLRKQFS